MFVSFSEEERRVAFSAGREDIMAIGGYGDRKGTDKEDRKARSMWRRNSPYAGILERLLNNG